MKVGFGVKQNLIKAIELYNKAANQGYAPAQCNLAYCYEMGIGIDVDLNEAVRYYRLAGDAGYPRALCI